MEDDEEAIQITEEEEAFSHCCEEADHDRDDEYARLMLSTINEPLATDPRSDSSRSRIGLDLGQSKQWTRRKSDESKELDGLRKSKQYFTKQGRAYWSRIPVVLASSNCTDSQLYSMFVGKLVQTASMIFFGSHISSTTNAYQARAEKFIASIRHNLDLPKLGPRARFNRIISITEPFIADRWQMKEDAVMAKRHRERRLDGTINLAIPGGVGLDL